MEAFIQQYGFLLLMGALLIVMMVFSNRSRKKMQEQQKQREEQLRTELTPGQWVHTYVGFWGRYVDTDGDVIVLETTDGTETYWDVTAIREVAEPPFASANSAVPEEDDANADEENEKPVLGLNFDSDSDTTQR